MKIRWTKESVRCRITPSEFAAIERGAETREVICLPGGANWRVAIVPVEGTTSLGFEAGELRICIGEDDRRRLADPEQEGVYFRHEGEPALRYFIEKDFPCAHPRAADALEPQSETFLPPAGFEERKNAET